MDKRIILADGTVIPDAYVQTPAGVLMIYVRNDSGMTMGDLFPLLNDPEKTERITAEAYGETTVYTGYTDLYSISRGVTQISAGLMKA